MLEELKIEEFSIRNDFISVYHSPGFCMSGEPLRAYRNNGTRKLDAFLGLDGSISLDDDFFRDGILGCVNDYSFGNSRVRSTLNYFLEEFTIKKWGVIVGVEENYLNLKWFNDESLRDKLHIFESIENEKLIRKKIRGDYVLFPANIRTSCN